VSIPASLTTAGIVTDSAPNSELADPWSGMREHSGFPDGHRNRYRFRSEFVGHREKSGRNIEQSTVNFHRRTTGERSSAECSVLNVDCSMFCPRPTAYSGQTGQRGISRARCLPVDWEHVTSVGFYAALRLRQEFEHKERKERKGFLVPPEAE